MQDTFNSGYTKALLDVKNMIERVIKTNTKLTNKNIMSLIDVIIDDRERMRKIGWCNLAYDVKQRKFKKSPINYLKDFEIYMENENE